MAKPKGSAKTGGRKKGTPNKLTSEVRLLIRSALDAVGGERYLRQCAKETPTAFLTLIGKLLPLEVQANVETEVVINVTTGIPDSPGSALGTTGTQAQRFAQNYAREQVAARAAAAAVPVPPEPQALAAGPEPIRPYVPPPSVPEELAQASEHAPSEPKPANFGNLVRRSETDRQAERWGGDEDAPRERIELDLKG